MRRPQLFVLDGARHELLGRAVPAELMHAVERELRDGAQEAADAAGVDLEVVDAQNDSATQTNQLATAATSGTDGVIINPVDSDAAAASVAVHASARW